MDFTSGRSSRPQCTCESFRMDNNARRSAFDDRIGNASYLSERAWRRHVLEERESAGGIPAAPQSIVGKALPAVGEKEEAAWLIATSSRFLSDSGNNFQFGPRAAIARNAQQRADSYLANLSACFSTKNPSAIKRFIDRRRASPNPRERWRHVSKSATEARTPAC